MSLRDAIDRTKTVLRSVLPFSASREATAVDFTAGSDTRLVAGALAERPDVAAALSFRVVGSPDSADVQISGRIARRLGWHHVTCPGVSDGLTSELLPSTAFAADGSFPLQLIASRLAFEARYATGVRHLVVGLNGELFRNWIWQPELFSMGRSTAINYNALLRHRIPRDQGLDALRVSAGLLTCDAHDQLLIDPFRRLEAQYPSALNVYKLDLVYIQRLMHRIPWDHPVSPSTIIPRVRTVSLILTQRAVLAAAPGGQRLSMADYVAVTGTKGWEPPPEGASVSYALRYYLVPASGDGRCGARTHAPPGGQPRRAGRRRADARVRPALRRLHARPARV